MRAVHSITSGPLSVVIDADGRQSIAALAVLRNLRVFLNCPTIPISSGHQFTFPLVATTELHSNVAAIQLIVAIGHEEVDLQRIIDLTALHELLSQTLEPVEVMLHERASFVSDVRLGSEADLVTRWLFQERGESPGRPSHQVSALPWQTI